MNRNTHFPTEQTTALSSYSHNDDTKVDLLTETTVPKASLKEKLKPSPFRSSSLSPLRSISVKNRGHLDLGKTMSCTQSGNSCLMFEGVQDKGQHNEENTHEEVADTQPETIKKNISKNQLHIRDDYSDNSKETVNGSGVDSLAAKPAGPNFKRPLAQYRPSRTDAVHYEPSSPRRTDLKVFETSSKPYLSPQLSRSGTSANKETSVKVQFGKGTNIAALTTHNHSCSTSLGLKRRFTSFQEDSNQGNYIEESNPTSLRRVRTEYVTPSRSADNNSNSTCNSLDEQQFNIVNEALSDSTNAIGVDHSRTSSAQPIRDYVTTLSRRIANCNTTNNKSIDQSELLVKPEPQKVADLRNCFVDSTTSVGSEGNDGGFTLEHWHRLTELYLEENRDYVNAGKRYYEEFAINMPTEELKWSEEELIWRCRCLDTYSRARDGYLPSLSMTPIDEQ